MFKDEVFKDDKRCETNRTKEKEKQKRGEMEREVRIFRGDTPSDEKCGPFLGRC